MTEPSRTPVLCAGYVNWDVVLHTDEVPDPDFSCDIDADHVSCGGSATNTAMALTGFDQPVALFGGVGDDEYGGRIQDRLRTVGVEPELVLGGETTVIYAMITPGDDPRYFARYGGAVSDFDADAVSSERWDETGHVHVETFSPEVSGALAQAAARDGKTVSFNPSQGYEDAEFPDAVAAADVIIINDREERIFRDRYDFDAVVADGTCIVVTHGADGSTAYTREGEVFHPGFPIAGEDVVDTIGAGDGFVAGFLSKWLETGDPKQALARGNATGAYAVTRVGAPDSVDGAWVQSLIDEAE